MELNGDSKLMRVFIGEIDKLHHEILYEVMLRKAKEEGMSGCSVFRGIMGFGASSKVHQAKLIEISEDLPVTIEVIDHEDKIAAFVSLMGSLLDEAGCGGLITVENANVKYYRPRKSIK
jgi:PII-like signaling protein